ncbi:MAG: hypothetical protein K0S00_4821 [Xanthobacteraceae bacterium]|nr:hypothetical protein [Xanthobacteraceae bacterium]
MKDGRCRTPGRASFGTGETPGPRAEVAAGGTGFLGPTFRLFAICGSVGRRTGKLGTGAASRRHVGALGQRGKPDAPVEDRGGGDETRRHLPRRLASVTGFAIFRASSTGGLAAVPAEAAGPQARGRRGGRVVEGARLESVYTGNRIAGSNPAPSAISVPNWARRA